MAPALIRVALVIVALLAGAWLVLGVRAIELESEAGPVPSAAQSESHAPREVRRAVSSLRRARLLSVDKAPLLNEGLLLFAAGRREAAIAITERLVAEEPANIEAWLALYTLYSVSGDTKRAGEAARRARALNPLVGDRLHDARP